MFMWVYMFLKCLHLTVLHHIVHLLNPISKMNWIKWLRVLFFLCCGSTVFFPDSDVVQLSHTKDEYVLPVTNRVWYSILISAAEPVVTTVCLQPGQVAPVTLHRPCRTKHCFHALQLPSTRTFVDPVTLTWPEGWLFYTAWQCSPLRCVWA